MSDEQTISRPTDPHAAHRAPLPAGTPRAIGRYEVLRLLGGGTFGRVYLAFDPEIERYVAVKMPILPPESYREFLREARIVAQLHHPNICPVYDVGGQNELPYIVMRYVAGGTLDDVLKRGLPTPEKALRIAGQIAKGLEAAHARGVFHRDLKPANVLYDEVAKELLLTDFGLARWTESGTQTTGGVKGTPAYMAPEQWGPGGQFGDISAQTDVYALGVMLFRLLTGVPLFPGDSPQQMFAHCFTPPRKPSEVNPAIGTRFDDLVLKALAKQPLERYGSARVFEEAIKERRRTLSREQKWRISNEDVEEYVRTLPQEQKWQITVPGEWSSRPVAGTSSWSFITRTPAEVMTQPSEIYRLSVSRTAQDVDLAGLSHLKGLRALQTLDLGSSGITDEGLAHLKALTNLQSLNLGFCDKITDKGLGPLAALDTLQTLHLHECAQITNKGLAHLAGLTSLQTLNLRGCNKITDAGLAHLKALTALHTLDLRSCHKITNAGLVHLTALTTLQTLHLWECDRITKTGITELKKALPTCKILR